MERPRRMKKHRRKGIILLMTLFFMVLFYMLAFGIYTGSQNGSGNGEGRTSLRDKTVTEASFACGAGLRLTKEWVAAVTKPGSGAGTNVEDLGSTWFNTNPANHIGTHTFVSANDDLFSVPSNDPNFRLRAVAGLSCPNGRFAGKTGIDFLGFKPDTNLTGLDYAAMKAEEGNWPVFVSTTPMTVGPYQVWSYIVPSAKAIASNSGASGDSLKSYLAISIAYRDGLPILRSRVLLKEVSSAKYAYRSNSNGTVGGQPVSWIVSDANSVLFDGPVHTNDVPVMSVATTYWDSALSYFSWDSGPPPLGHQHPKRAFMGGGLTFSASNTLGLTRTPDADGVGYQGGNILGVNSDTRRPYDAAGTPITSIAQGAQPDPLGGPIKTRYDRLIEGGREAIRKIPSVPLPTELVNLKAGAWGSDSVTGLSSTDPNPANWGVDLTQKNGSLQVASVARPSYINSSGVLVPAAPHDNTPAKEAGIFVNPVAGGSAAAGGVAVKGDTRNMYLEVTDSNGKLVTTGLDVQSPAAPTNSGSTAGNPTVRIQSTIDSYDSNTGTKIDAYTASFNGGTWVPTVNGVWVPTSAGTWIPTVNGVWIPTTNGAWVPTVNGAWVPTVNGTWIPTVNGVWQATVNGTWIPTVNGVFGGTVNGVWQATVNGVWQATIPGVWVDPTGSGSGSGYWSSATVNGKWNPATQNGKWNPATQAGKWTTVTVNGYTSGYSAGKWNPATQNGKWSPPTQNGYTSAATPGYTSGFVAGKWSPATKNGYTSGASAGKWSPATKNGYTSGASTTYTTAGVTPVLDPLKYKAQDWVVDVKNVNLVIPTTMPLPTPAAEATDPQSINWQKGYAGRVPVGTANALQAPLLGKVPSTAKSLDSFGNLVPAVSGISEVWFHPPGDTVGSKLSSAMTVPKGKIAVFKQSRSDSNRVDVFLLDNPNGPSSTKPGLSGAIYGTGNISGLRGVNMEAKTIGVDFSTNKAISLMDNVTQYGTVPGAKTLNGYHGLGLVGTALNVQTLENNFDNTNRFYIYATMIAGRGIAGNTGGMDVSRSNLDTVADFTRTASTTNTNAVSRTLFVYGGLTEQQTKARLLGSAGGSMGWNQLFNFDKQLSFMPPPFFPSTNQLAPLAYYQEVVIGQ